MIAACFNFNLFSLIKDIIQSVVLIANIILIVYFFLSNRKKEKINRENDKKSTWFRKLLVEPHFEEIPKLFDNLNQITERLKSSINKDDFKKLTVEGLHNHLSIAINDINQQISNFKDNFIDIVYSLDENFANVLVKSLEEIRDYLTENIGNISKDGPEILIETSKEIKRSKVTFTKLLYDYDLLLN